MNLEFLRAECAARYLARILTGFLSVTCLLQEVSAREPHWSHHVASRLASSPLIVENVVWIPKVGGDIEARDITTGNRICKIKTPKDVIASPMSGDSLSISRIGERPDCRIIANSPPHERIKIDMPSRLLGVDVWPGGFVFLLPGPSYAIWCEGRGVGPYPLLAAGPGWTELEAVTYHSYNPLIIVGRRQGETVLFSGDERLDEGPAMPGGIVEMFSHHDDIILFGREGIVVSLDSTLTKKWMVQLDTGLQWEPALYGSSAWLATRDRGIVHIDLLCGEVTSVKTLDHLLPCSPVGNARGVFYACDAPGIVWDDPRVMESQYSETLLIRGPAVGIAADDDHVVVATRNGDLSCFRLIDDTIFEEPTKEPE